MVTVANNAADTTAPTVALTAPVAGTVSGTVNVTASASDNVGVAGVQFRVDGANLGPEDTTSPYSITWSTAGTPNGSHVLSAVARDAAGNTNTSTSVSITVSNNVADTTAPTVNITAPVGGISIGGTTTISATASDNVGVTGVQFLVDGYHLGTEMPIAPFSMNWATAGVSNGTHTLVARAHDAAGNWGSSAPVSFTVNNTSGSSLSASAPTVSMSSASRRSCTATIQGAPPAAGTWTAQFLDGSRSLGTDGSSPYSLRVSVSTGQHSFSIQWTAAGQSAVTSAVTTSTCQ